MFSENLIKLRNEKGYTQSQLADKLGVVKGTIANYEKGFRKPDNETLIKIAHIFNVSVDYLLGVNTIEQPTVVVNYNADNTKTPDITFDDFTYAMFNEVKDLTEEQKAALLNMAKILKDSNK